MKYGICKLSAVAVRNESDETSEMISQLLFGEIVKLPKSKKEWFYIKSHFDETEGWVKRNQLEIIEEKEFTTIKNQKLTFCTELVEYLHDERNTELIPITLGALLPFYFNHKITLSNKEYIFEGKSISSINKKDQIIKMSFMLLNTPYLKGGKTPFGIDSSAFVQLMYKINGHTLKRKAQNQALQGEVLSFIEESEQGDLAFFDDEEGNINHVGIILQNNYIIHSFGKVRIDRLDQTGIFNLELKKHTHKLRIIKKIF